MNERLLSAFFLLVALAPVTSLPAQTVNGCSLATAENHLSDPIVTITFPNGIFTYDPDCIIVKPGAQLTFNGEFNFHPLRGGSWPTTDPASPIPSVSAGTTANFLLDEPGIFGFFCDVHGSGGMDGAVIVAIFADGFEEDSDTCDWSSTVPQPVCS